MPYTLSADTSGRRYSKQMKTKNEWKEIYSYLYPEALKKELRALKKIGDLAGSKEAIEALEELLNEKE